MLHAIPCVYLNLFLSNRDQMAIRLPKFAGANAWRNFEGVMGDRRMSLKLKRKMVTSCAAPAYMYGLETTPLTE